MKSLARMACSKADTAKDSLRREPTLVYMSLVGFGDHHAGYKQTLGERHTQPYFEVCEAATVPISKMDLKMGTLSIEIVSTACNSTF